MYNDLEKLYKSLGDEESKVIFRQRLMYALTGDLKYIKEMLLFYKKDSKGYLNLLDVLDNPEILRNKEIVLFGTGVWAYPVKRWLDYCKLEINFYCDNNQEKWGKEFRGKKILAPRELFEEHTDAMVIVSTEKYENEVVKQLLDNTFSNEQIIRLSYTDKKIYFDEDIVNPQSEEVFVDGGCYDAETSLEFVEWAKGSAKKYLHLNRI